MKKVKVIIQEWECKEVEYVCEVDDTYYDKNGNKVEECDGVCKGDSSVTDCYGDCGNIYDENGDVVEKWDAFGIGYLDGSDLCTDAEGFNAIPISKKVLDGMYDSKWDMVEWEIINQRG